MSQQAEPPKPVAIPRPEEMKGLDVEALVALWQAHNPKDWATHLELYQTLGKRLVKLGEPLVAYDVLSEGLNPDNWPQDVLLRQQQALALSRSGATERAEALLKQLYDEGHRDEETLGIRARTHKDRAMRAEDPATRTAHLERAYTYYREAYACNQNAYWTGINSATMALLLGRQEEARKLASEVRELCLRELDKIKGTDADEYWPLATLGEAALILGDQQEAEHYYERAAEYARHAEQQRSRYADLASTRRNARMIIEHQGGDSLWLDQVLKLPRVVVFTGHMVDQTGRKRPRFPSSSVPQVRAAIRQRLVELDAGFGYSSAASGSDILFLESLLERGGEAHVILPFNKEQFMRTSVEIVPDGDWRRRCDYVLSEATEVLVASEQQMHAEGMSYEYTNLLLQGLAAIKAAQLETELAGLAVWDGRRGDGPGGTSTAIGHWQESKIRVELIDLKSLVRQQFGEVAPAPAKQTAAGEQSKPTAKESEFKPQIKAMLFADAYHFSKLVENQIPIFYQHFMKRIGDLIGRTAHAPVMKKTWGDGLYFVFDTVRAAGLFALELCDEINGTKWPDYGLPADLNLRIGLHAGPIYACLDPVTNEHTYIGSHVTRTARIEPITPPGLVYTSQSFAALAVQQRIRDFICEYVGSTPLPKGFGTIPAYLLRRTRG